VSAEHKAVDVSDKHGKADAKGIELLYKLFDYPYGKYWRDGRDGPTGPDEMNWIFWGVDTRDDRRCLLEALEEYNKTGDESELWINILIIHPRTCGLLYGTIKFTVDDVGFLNMLGRKMQAMGFNAYTETPTDAYGGIRPNNTPKTEPAEEKKE